MVRLYLPVALYLALSATFVKARYVVYYDQNHLHIPNNTVNAGIDYVITAYANSSLFTTSPAGEYFPFEAIPSVRSHFDEGTKVLISIGGPGDTAGFSIGAANNDSRKNFAANVAKLLKKFGFDGVDIDWEYPGAKDTDYRQLPNTRVSEVDTYPLLLADISSAIGPNKLLTIAAPGKLGYMFAYTPEKAPSIWQSVDWVNVKTFDFLDRRGTITRHHSDVRTSIKSIDYYINSLKLDPKKINLGFALHSKWVTVDPTRICQTGLGCATVPLETADGTDTGRSGTVSFESRNYGVPPANLTESTNGTCGPKVSMFCRAGLCCSTFGFCGDTVSHCNACQGIVYGSGCTTAPPENLFQIAMRSGVTDHVAGGQYFYDHANSLFWTWDTPDLIARKFFEIVTARGIGGVVAWSLGKDNYNFSHILALQKHVAERREVWIRDRLRQLLRNLEIGW